MTATHDVSIAELVSAHHYVKQNVDELTAQLKVQKDQLEDIRTDIERRLRESGATSHTDAATGINCRIDTRNDWKVTNPKAAMEFIRRTERFELLTVDTKAAIDYRKGEGSYPIPGIEQVESKRLVVTPPKGAK